MITILNAHSGKIATEFELNDLLDRIPSELHQRAFRYHRSQDAYNKPIIEGLFFSISHSGDHVLCAFSKEKELGIDIEKRKKVDLALFKEWFSDRNWQTVFASEDPLLPFFKLWAQKESVLKALGTGLSQLKKVEILNDQEAWDGKQTWFIQNLDITEGYTAALSCDIKIDPKSIKIVSWSFH